MKRIWHRIKGFGIGMIKNSTQFILGLIGITLGFLIIAYGFWMIGIIWKELITLFK